MNPVIFSVGHFELRFYSVFILAGVLTSVFLIYKESKRFNIDTDFLFNLMFYGIIFGIIGARIYYVIFNWDFYKNNLVEIIQIWNGGIAIHGAIIAGLITIILYCKKKKINPLRMTDIVAVPLILSQAIGRWGNFFNGEAHGAATTYLWLINWPVSFLRNIPFLANMPDPKFLHMPKFIVDGMCIDGVYYIPTFFFESLSCVFAFIILLIIRRRKYIHLGTPTAWYLIFYGTIRFLIETTRTDALMIGPFKMAQIISIIMLLVGIGLLLYNAFSNKYTNLYNKIDETDV